MKQFIGKISVSVVAAAVILWFFAPGPTLSSDLASIGPLNKPAVKTARAPTAFLTALTRAGDRLVAVGERGIAIFSDDNGKTWVQGLVPVSVTLTGVSFPSSDKGWAVGHSGVVLASEDGGKTWQKVLDGAQVVALLDKDTGEVSYEMEEDEDLPLPPMIGASDPFLDVYFENETSGFILGAFGVILRTRDGGKTWVPWHTHLPNPDGNHLYDMASVAGSLWIAAERGAAFVSQDGGNAFTSIRSPYEGSFFGICVLGDSQILLFGLQGHIFRSMDIGTTWQQIEVNTQNSWTDAAPLKDNSTVLVNQSSDIIVVESDGKTIRSLSYKHAPFPLSAVAQAADGNIVVAGSRGVRVIEYN